jgi:hypothetical protein
MRRPTVGFKRDHGPITAIQWFHENSVALSSVQ